MDIYYIDDDFVTGKKPMIPATDLSVLRGFGVFDALRTYNRHPFHLKDHLLRLGRSAKLMGLPLPKPLAEIETIVRDGIEQSEHEECLIRLFITGGDSSDGMTPAGRPRLLIMITAVTRLAPESYRNGCRAITSCQQRFLPGAKSINYIPAILCLREARSRGAIESIYQDNNGYLLEGTTSNFFAIIEGRLVTPPCDRILPGITRQVTLKLSRKFMEVEERSLHREELRLIDEAFITSSVREIVPIVGVDSINIGDGVVGPATSRIVETFAEYTATCGADGKDF